MTACPIRYQRQVSDRKGKIFYTSITSLSHISKVPGHEAADGWRRRCSHWHYSGATAVRPVRLSGDPFDVRRQTRHEQRGIEHCIISKNVR